MIDPDDTEFHSYASHAEGVGTTAKGAASHAEGDGTLAVGKHSHAEGRTTTTEGEASHTEGADTIAQNYTEHAEGKFNATHKNSNVYGDALNTQHSIGIGSGVLDPEGRPDRKNAVEVMQNGDTYVFGIGGFNGHDVESAKTVQEVIEELNNKIDLLMKKVSN